jgi:branched-chain amino acid transport system permease protein
MKNKKGRAINKISKSTLNNIITVAIIIVFYIICQIMISAGIMKSLFEGLLIPVCYYSILAVSLNLTVGILGELSLGHAGFMCAGAFAGALFSKCTKDVIDNTFIRFTLAILLGAFIAALLGALIGVVVLRLRGDYLAIVTLAFGEIIKNIMNVLYVGIDGKGLHASINDAASLNLKEDGEIIIKGAQGIVGTPNDSTFIVSILLLILTYLVVSNLVHSRSGRAIMAIRDNRIAAESIGIDITKFKILAFSISAAMAGIAGVLYAHNISSLVSTPKTFGYNTSILILVFVVLGGMGNIRGSIIAASILTFLPEYLRFLNNYRMLIYAIVLIAMMIFNWNPACIDWRKKHSLKKVLTVKKLKKEV